MPRSLAPIPGDLLTLANELDGHWHDQSRSFEREALTRFWGLLSLGAGVLDPSRPREMLRAATVLRNVRFQGAEIRQFFFSDQEFTEVDGIYLQVGSTLGHIPGEDAWVVEVERKAAHGQGDYYKAIQRAEKFASLLGRCFRLRARPVVIFEDEDGRFTARSFEHGVLLIPMSTLRARTQGLRFSKLDDLPGLACDRTLVKLALIRQLTEGDPHRPGWYSGPLALARAVESSGFGLRLPVAGHQNTDTFPDTLVEYLNRQREPDTQLASRIDRYLQELAASGAITLVHSTPRLSLEGGKVALRLLAAERMEHQ